MNKLLNQLSIGAICLSIGAFAGVVIATSNMPIPLVYHKGCVDARLSSLTDMFVMMSGENPSPEQTQHMIKLSADICNQQIELRKRVCKQQTGKEDNLCIKD